MCTKVDYVNDALATKGDTMKRVAEWELEQSSAVVPRLSIAGCSAVRWVGMVVLCCTGLCGVVLWMLMTMVPCTEVLMSEGDYGHKTCRLWPLWSESLFRSAMSKSSGWYSPFCEFFGLGGTGGRATIGCMEKAWHPVSSLTQWRVQCAPGLFPCGVVGQKQQQQQQQLHHRYVFELNCVPPKSVDGPIVLLLPSNNIEFIELWLRYMESQPWKLWSVLHGDEVRNLVSKLRRVGKRCR